jgi:hypothetical protein
MTRSLAERQASDIVRAKERSGAEWAPSSPRLATRLPGPTDPRRLG